MRKIIVTKKRSSGGGIPMEKHYTGYARHDALEAVGYEFGNTKREQVTSSRILYFYLSGRMSWCKADAANVAG